MKWFRWMSTALCGVVAVAACALDRPGELDQGGRSFGPSLPGPCASEGSTQACHEKVSEHAGVVTCFNGVQRCTNGSWTRCQDGSGSITSKNVSGGGVGTVTANSFRVDPTTMRMASSEEAVKVVERARTFGVPALARSSLASFKKTEEGIEPVLASGFASTAARSRAARVSLPERASGVVRVEHGNFGIGFGLRDGTAAPFETANGWAVYRSALGSADVLQRVDEKGIEDFISFAAKPAREVLDYDVDVSRVAGLRLVANTLEFIDEHGTPQLRVAPPYVVDASGHSHKADLRVRDCAVDTSPVAPWGRAVTAPGHSRCTVEVDWSGAHVAYPAIVDPSWATTGSMASPRIDFGTEALTSGRVLVTGGSDATVPPTYYASAELYDPATRTFAATGNMTSTRASFGTARLLSGKVLVVGGTNAAGHVAVAEIYNPVTGLFSLTGSISPTRLSPTATTLPSGRVLILGGYRGFRSAAIELFNEATGNFDSLASMAAGRYRHSATLMANGKVLVAGGTQSAAPTEIFDPASNTFSTSGSLVKVREAHSAAFLSTGKVLIAGGFGPGGTLSDAELFDPVTGTSAATGSMSQGRAYATSVVLGAGNVLIGGGEQVGIQFLSSVELFDPGTSTFTAGPSLLATRTAAQSARLSDGSVLVVGGKPSNGVATATAEVFTLSPAGAPCGSNGECGSGLCDQSVCCAAACAGTCKKCELGTGACIAVLGEEDPNSCSGDHVCTEDGVCAPGSPVSCADNPCDPTCQRWTTNAGDAQPPITTNDSGINAYSTLSFTERFTATCPEGMHVQWGTLTYSATVPSNASGSSTVTFSSATADSTFDGSVSEAGASIVLAESPPSDADCQLPGCFVDLYTQLGGRPQAGNEILELTVTLAPSPDGLVAPTIHGWQVRYSCPAAE